jgi:hypothetical protein
MGQGGKTKAKQGRQANTQKEKGSLDAPLQGSPKKSVIPDHGWPSYFRNYG